MQVDGPMPNLALMKLVRWHAAQGDTVLPRGEHAPADLAYVSCIFTRNADKARRYAATFKRAELGGSGIDLSTRLPEHVEACAPDYEWAGIDYGIGFLTRGCIRRCPYCVVPDKEGRIRRASSIASLLNPRSNRLVLLDGNFLAHPDAPDLLREMDERLLRVSFTQGLDIRLVTPEIAMLLRSASPSNWKFTRSQVYFAFDDPALWPAVRDGIDSLIGAGFPPSTLQFYVLCGFNTTREQDWDRFEKLRGRGCEPFVMIYQRGTEESEEPRDPDQDRELRRWARWVNQHDYKRFPYKAPKNAQCSLPEVA